jgi:hypothetical protein
MTVTKYSRVQYHSLFDKRISRSSSLLRSSLSTIHYDPLIKCSCQYHNGTVINIIWYSTGDGSTPAVSFTVGDFNNDNQLYIIVANYGIKNIIVLFGLGDGTFLLGKEYSTGIGSTPIMVVTADFDNNNRLDIVVTNTESDNIISLFGYGNGMFTNGTIYSTGIRSHPYIVTIGDLNNDHRLDIAIANSGTKNILLFYGYENGTFGNDTLGYEYRPYSIAINDLNEDGWMDLFIGCYGTDNVEIIMKMC